jgi:BASS family bile acid:Na+ symporter
MTTFEMIKLAVVASIFLTVLGIGMSATVRDVTFLLREPGLLFRSFLSMFVVMPVVVTVIAQVSNLPEAVKIALVALAIAPVPPILPRRELKAGCHADYAVGLLAVGALIAIVYVPLAVEILDRIFGRHGDVSRLAIAKIVLITILAPLLIGMAIRQWAPSAAAKGAGRVLTTRHDPPGRGSTHPLLWPGTPWWCSATVGAHHGARRSRRPSPGTRAGRTTS